MSKESSKGQAKIPTDEEFARADANQAKQSQVFEQVRRKILRRFSRRAPLHDVYLFPSRFADYDAFIFYKNVSDIETCRGNGVEDELKQEIVSAFAAMTCNDNPNVPAVRFVFDSHENVKKVCNGDYWKYLR